MIKKGDMVPSATLMTMTADGPTAISTADLFAGQRVALFGVPGAYTPVCSAEHLPGFVDGSDQLVAKGIDSVACVSVNDPFVIDAWGRENGADNILMLADTDGQFTRAMGLSVRLDDFGLGERSKRYSMIVNDGTVEALNVEESVLDHGVSSCSTLVGQA